MRFVVVLVALLSVVAALPSTITVNKSDSGTCGTDPSKAKADCNHEDMGSCGNACCMLEVVMDEDMDTVVSKITDALKAGGADGLYAFVDGEDLRQYNIPPWEWILQGTHTTFSEKYTDTLDINFRTGPKNSTVVRAFSISNIHGALGDYGQNFKNLKYLLDYSLIKGQIQMKNGCGVNSL